MPNFDSVTLAADCCGQDCVRSNPEQVQTLAASDLLIYTGTLISRRYFRSTLLDSVNGAVRTFGCGYDNAVAHRPGWLHIQVAL
jgi:hypothetical protein